MGNTPSKRSSKRNSKIQNASLNSESSSKNISSIQKHKHQLSLPTNLAPLCEINEVEIRNSHLSPVTVEPTIEPILKPFGEEYRKNSLTSAENSLLSTSSNTNVEANINNNSNNNVVFDLDNIILQLVEIGKSSNNNNNKVPKILPFKQSQINTICLLAREVFMSQPTLIEISAPVKVVGDIHGQYTDLIRLFNLCGYPPSSNFLFLGDYVDRGKQSLETILLLLCYKIKYPENFFLLRGNHECANVTRGINKLYVFLIIIFL